MIDQNSYVGRKIGNYRLAEKIGSGGFGSVYRAEHLLIDRVAAIKLLLKVHFNSELERDGFIKEARVLAKLEHPYILHLMDVGIEEELPYLITDFAAGGSLEEYIQRQPSRALPLATALTILSQIGEALQYAHEQSIVHRDLKPANILFDEQNQVLLADFGIATILTEKNLKHTDNIVGSPPYMAPELFDGDISKECDQYALACVAYELLTGRNLFDLPRNALPMVWVKKHIEENPIPLTKLNPNLPVHIEQAILKALAKHRDGRYPDIKSFITALSAFSSQTTDFAIDQASIVSMLSSKALPISETSTTNPSQKTIKQWFVRGDAYYRAGRFEEALICLEQAISLDSKSATVYYQKGVCLYELERQQPGHLWRAIAAFQQAIYLEPMFAEAYIGIGDVYYRFRNYNDALKNYQEATCVAPESALGYYRMGSVLTAQKRYDEAISAYDSALHFDPKSRELYFLKGDLLEYLRRYEEALATYADAIQFAPTLPDAYVKRGELLERLERYEEALSVWEQIIKLDPMSVEAYYRKGSIYERFRSYEEALSVWEQIIKLDSLSDQAYYRMGKTLEKLEGHELLYEGGPSVLQAFFYRLISRQRYKDALMAYKHAIRLRPEYSSYHICKGNVLKHLGRVKEAILAYEKGAELEEAEKLNTKKVAKGERRVSWWVTYNKRIIENVPGVYLPILNPLLIPIALGIVLHSWLAFASVFVCVFFLTALFLGFVDDLHMRRGAVIWLLPATLVSIGWACMPLLAISSNFVAVRIALTIVSFLVGFFGNVFLYLFVEIYGDRLLRQES